VNLVIDGLRLQVKTMRKEINKESEKERKKEIGVNFVRDGEKLQV